MNSTAPITFEEARESIRKSLRPESFQNMVASELRDVQERLGFGSELGQLTFPLHYLRPGSRTKSPPTVKLLPKQLNTSSDVIEAARLQATRYALLIFIVPTGTHSERQLPAMSTFIHRLRYITTLVQMSIESMKKADVSQGVFCHLEASAIQQALAGGLRKRAGIEIARMWQLRGEGLWADAPTTEHHGRFEKSRLNADAAHREEERSNPYLPFPDEFVAEAGWRACWLMDELAAPLLRCAREIAPLMQRQFDSPSPQTRKLRRHKLVKAFLKKFDWRTQGGQQIKELPFELGEKANRWGATKIWPPTGASHIKGLLHLLQFAHLYAFLLSSGARISESLSIVPGAVVTIEGSESVEGRTFKLVYSVDGARKEWPLIGRIASALVQQEHVRDALLQLPDSGSLENNMPEAAACLWVGPHGGDLDRNYATLLRNSVRCLRLEPLLGDAPFHAHRFRKTLARIAALALVGAPKILMDLFGHKTISMTLHYILTDPQLRAEIEEVARAQTIMLATEAINEAEHIGGGAAATFQAAVVQERARIGRAFGAADIQSLAEILTLSGQSWQLVRPGIICTKTASQVGPCAQSLGAPEPSRCQTSCGHRLERAFLHDDVDKSIKQAVEQLAMATECGDDILAEEWRGQILANLRRFPDLESKWSGKCGLQVLSKGAT